MRLGTLALANLRHRPFRTVCLSLLVALLAFSALAGALASQSLNNGLSSLEARLGADVLVAPQNVKSKSNLESILLDGTPGQFYMDKSYVEKVAAIDGVEAVSPQYYLATVKAGCCSMPVQVIGFDPETDFTIQPWIARTYGDELGRGDIVTGSNITGTAGSTVLFYGKECRIVARLDETGTELDNAVYATNETLQDLIAGSQEQGISVLAENDPTEVVSTISVKVADGVNPSDIADYINVHVRGLKAVAARAMTAGVADGVAGAAQVIGVLVGVICIVSLVVLVVAFTVIGRLRSREFAALRVMGASRAMLSRLVLMESLVVGVIGAVVGCAVALVAVVAFNGAIEEALGLPFLLPDVGSIVVAVVVVMVASVLAACVSSILSARKVSSVDAGQILREG